ncbi:MAG TPA: endolytic transglycosylase MltG [Bacteroidota bacterium]|nr:endolytic transglycosylase MltG [Bacteroidota bacterium]
MSRAKRFGIIAGVVLLLMLGVAYEIFWAPNWFDGDRFITVSKGENFRQVVDSLESAEIIRSRLLVDAAGRLSGYTTKMQIGKYRFKSGMSNLAILTDLRQGTTTELIIVTVPPGMKPTRLAHLLFKHLGIDSSRFLGLVNDSSFVHRLGIPANSLIGYLTPMTYKFYWQTDEESIAKELVTQFWGVFDSSLRATAASKGLTMNEVLTMASIVENETSIDSERAMIAGVYYNRLRRNMRLQADPTVEFLLDDGPRKLAYSDLDRDSPYNTYRHEGLPPGPINSPGRASILAALYPDHHKYLFFVATGYGGHHFSRTFSQHQKAIRQYRRVKEEQEEAKEATSLN